MADRVGQQLGNYRLTQVLGAGGFAEVYLAQHIYLDTQVAVKVLGTKLGPSEREHFRNEARTIAALRHPHIVRVLDFGVQDDTPFLVMEYAPNGTLRQRYPAGTQLPLATIISSVKQVAAALQAAHEAKVIHRDIKPENMLLGPQNEVWLSDFGIATEAQNTYLQETGNFAGTASYAAPEQLQGRPRPASDQYALGVVVYEWLSGDRPFHGSSLEIASQHVMVPPPPLRERIPNLAPLVEEVIMTALAKDPHQRFATVAAFANALEQASSAAQAPEAASAPLLFAPPEITSAPTILTPGVASAETPSRPGGGNQWASAPILSGPQADTPSLPPTFVTPAPAAGSGPARPPAAAPAASPGSRDAARGPRKGLVAVIVVIVLVVIFGGTAAAILRNSPRSSSTAGSSSATSTPADTSDDGSSSFSQSSTTGDHITSIQTGTGYDPDAGAIEGETGTFSVGDTIWVVFTVTDPQDSATVVAKVLDDSGNVITSDAVDISSGAGQYAASGTATDTGIYTIEIDYNDSAEATITFQVAS